MSRSTGRLSTHTAQPLDGPARVRLSNNDHPYETVPRFRPLRQRCGLFLGRQFRLLGSSRWHTGIACAPCSTSGLTIQRMRNAICINALQTATTVSMSARGGSCTSPASSASGLRCRPTSHRRGIQPQPDFHVSRGDTSFYVECTVATAAGSTRGTQDWIIDCISDVETETSGRHQSHRAGHATTEANRGNTPDCAVASRARP